MKNIIKYSIFSILFSQITYIYSQSVDSTFSNIDSALLNPLQVKTLDLSSQGLFSISSSVSSFLNLQVLNLNNNPGLDLKTTFSNLITCKKIKVLYLENNNLTTLPTEITKLNNLQYLYLKNNHIQSIPKGMKNLNLYYIDLGNNNIKDWNLTEIFKILPNSTTVNISYSLMGFENKSLKYFEEGNKATNMGEYMKADSLYSLSLSYERQKDTYFNRAIVKKKLNDIDGYCADLINSANLNDREANHLYWKDCGTIDSIFYNKNGTIVKKGEHAYCEITSKSKYTKYLRFKKIDFNKQILVHFEVINDDSIFYAASSSPKYSGSEEKLKEFLATNVVPNETERKSIRNALIIISFNILKNGEVEDVNVISAFSKTFNNRLAETFNNEIKKWAPALYEGKPVKYQKVIRYYLNSN